jgi:hypothetical protein
MSCSAKAEYPVIATPFVDGMRPRPDGKILIPGVITQSTVLVEHLSDYWNVRLRGP